ncbi:hypothetical protein [Streptomyces fungicidicus]|uniref:hypothetical protein n=1 Tax=Streptomyces fungicidicus TaxID=68203 RepID=UPI0036C0098C
MGPRVRTGVLLVMWALVLWGVFEAGGGVVRHGLSPAVECSWINVGPDGEEHPSPMGPGDRCYRRDGGHRTYEEQRAAQRAERDDIVAGSWVLGAGVLGLGALSLHRRLGSPTGATGPRE